MPPGGVVQLAQRKAGLALIGETLGNIAEPLVIAGQCREFMKGRDLVNLGNGHNIDCAKLARVRMLRSVATVDAARSALLEIIVPGCRHPVTRADASRMLGVLFGSLAKRKPDENQTTLLAACAEMFEETHDQVGEVTGLWKPVSHHPAALALTVRALLATSRFSPAPVELREAMQKVALRIRALAGYARQWLDHVDRADQIVFEHDREAWAASFANLPSAILLAMMSDRCESERDAALEKIWAEKHDAEKA
jgi:hypothetical protein